MVDMNGFKTNYEDMPLRKLIPRKGGKGSKMSNKSTTPEVKTSKAKYTKTRGEHTKDIIIAVLITGVIAFGLGIYVEHNRNTDMQRAISAATVTVKK